MEADATDRLCARLTLLELGAKSEWPERRETSARRNRRGLWKRDGGDLRAPWISTFPAQEAQFPPKDATDGGSALGRDLHALGLHKAALFEEEQWQRRIKGLRKSCRKQLPIDPADMTKTQYISGARAATAAKKTLANTRQYTHSRHLKDRDRATLRAMRTAVETYCTENGLPTLLDYEAEVVIDTPPGAPPQHPHTDFTFGYNLDVAEVRASSPRRLPLPIAVLVPLEARGRYLYVHEGAMMECPNSTAKKLHIAGGEVLIFAGTLPHYGAEGDSSRNLSAHWLAGGDLYKGLHIRDVKRISRDPTAPPVIAWEVDLLGFPCGKP